MSHRFVLTIALPLLLVSGGLAACTDDGAGTRSDSGSASGSGSGTADVACETVGDPDAADVELGVSLTDYEIQPESDTAAAGTVAFSLDNEADEPHEFVVVQADSADDLPLSGGTVDEEALPDGAFIGEVSPFPGGETCQGAFDLATANYVLFCNVDDHFARGMHTTFTVT